MQLIFFFFFFFFFLWINVTAAISFKAKPSTKLSHVESNAVFDEFCGMQFNILSYTACN